MHTAIQTRTPLKRAFLFAVPAMPRRGGLFAVTPFSRPTLRKALAAQPAVRPWTRRALPFRNFPPAPKRTMTPLPLALREARTWIESRYTQDEGYTTEGIALLCLLQQMRVDNVLFSRDWRLELVWTGKKGYPYWGLYWRRWLMGLVDIPVAAWGGLVQDSVEWRRLSSQMAAYLVCAGFTRANTVLVEGLAQTPTSASKRDVYRLFV